MGIKEVRNYFISNNLKYDIQEFSDSTATVQLAAEALGVEPGMIAKSMAFKSMDIPILVISKGTSRIDNRKFKDTFNCKAKMLSPEEVLKTTGHPVGGVCPFGLKTKMDIYLDISLKDYDFVYPAAGSKNSAIKISVNDLEIITKGKWVHICK